MTRGLGYIGISQEEQARMLDHDKVDDFKAHYGSSPLVIVAM
jgi:predicted GIY-YIG superfamily endonuclease